MAADKWDASGKYTTHSLSTDEQTIWSTSAAYGPTHSVGSAPSGKWYVEIHVIGTVDNNSVYGLGDGTQTASYPGSAGEDSIGWSISGTAWNGTYGSTVAIGAVIAGDVICLAIDANTGKVYGRINNGAWANSGDPVAGTGELNTLSGEIYLCASPYAVGSVTNKALRVESDTANLSYTPPTGYGPWEDAGTTEIDTTVSGSIELASDVTIITDREPTITGELGFGGQVFIGWTDATITGEIGFAGDLDLMTSIAEIRGEFGVGGSMTAHTINEYTVSGALGFGGDITVTSPFPVAVIAGALGFGGTIAMFDHVNEITGAIGLDGSVTMFADRQNFSIDGGLGLSGSVTIGSSSATCTMPSHSSTRWS